MCGVNQNLQVVKRKTVISDSGTSVTALKKAAAADGGRYKSRPKLAGKPTLPEHEQLNGM
jgi:hypothetical protein